MLERGHGSIINLSTIAARRGEQLMHSAHAGAGASSKEEDL
jgi:hypothetical protein